MKSICNLYGFREAFPGNGFHGVGQSMALNSDAARLGPYYGDENILVYRKTGNTKSIFTQFFET
ncbi:hypothetical protein [Salegentibacter sp. F14]